MLTPIRLLALLLVFASAAARAQTIQGTVSSGGTFSRFGFTNTYLVNGVWYLVPRNVAGDVETVCALQPSSILCQ